MNAIWTPELTPPQLTDEAVRLLCLQIEEEGVQEVATRALVTLQNEDEALAVCLDEFGMALNASTPEGIWPAKILMAGAALARQAYREAGFIDTVDENAVGLGRMIAEVSGIPDTYVMSVHEDTRLLDMTMQTAQLPAFDDSHKLVANRGRYTQVLGLGAGFTRHYLQYTLEG